MHCDGVGGWFQGKGVGGVEVLTEVVMAATELQVRQWVEA